MDRLATRLLVAPLCLLALPAFLPGGAANAALLPVTNCSDSGAGSLRAVVAGAASGDVVDLRGLTCSRITLSGEIRVPQDDLELFGRGPLTLTIDGNRAGRVLNHTGTGWLTILGLSISNGLSEPALSPQDDGNGGCIRSNLGTVKLRRARVHGCEAYDPEYTSGSVSGGGIFAKGVILVSSSVFDNKAGAYGVGGGIYGQSVRVHHSQVYGNTVEFDGGGIYGYDVLVAYSSIYDNQANRGGGISCLRLTLNKSTVSNNRAVLRFFWGGYEENQAGGLRVIGEGRSVVVDSTISGNSAFNYSAAAFHNGSVGIYNSTITDNNENYPEGDVGYHPPSYFGRGALYAATLQLKSTIVSGNRRVLGAPPYDIAAGVSLSGSNNIIGYSQVPTPADTIAVIDPRVEPLADNGGITLTHALKVDSPAREQGSNVLSREYDQRGRGFPRVKGAFPDIGSYEY